MRSEWERQVEVLREMDIVAVAERCGAELRRRGSTMVTLCPWHEDHHPSLVLYPATHSCYCFACGHGGNPIDYVMAKLGVGFREACEFLEPGVSSRGDECRRRISHASMHMSSREILPPSGRLNDKKNDIQVWDYRLALSYVSMDNSLVQGLLRVFPRAEVERVSGEYLLGCYEELGRPDDVLFPSIDIEGRVRDMKIQHYCTEVGSPRFLHADRGVMLWWAGLPGVRSQIPEGRVVDRNCLFGEHLLARHPERDVVLVESPKNAVVGSLVMPQYVWVAVGNKSMLKREVCGALQGRRVIVIPDRDAIDDWASRLETMHSLAHFVMSDFQERHRDEGDGKFDVADYVIAKAMK